MVVYSPKTLRNEIGISERTYFRRMNQLKKDNQEIRENIDVIDRKKNWDEDIYNLVKQSFGRFGIVNK